MAAKDKSLQLDDTPSQRVLNVFVGVEAVLIKYVEEHREDKEAKIILADVRKCLAGTLGALPAPDDNPKKSLEGIALKASAYARWGF